MYNTEHSLTWLKYIGNENGNETARKVVKTLHHEAQADILEVEHLMKHNQAKSERSADEIPIPECREDFELGVEVEITCTSANELESILTRTTGWTDPYRSLLKKTGYVIKKSYGMGTNVAVRYHDTSFVAYLYPGVLKKVQKSDGDESEKSEIKQIPLTDKTELGKEQKSVISALGYAVGAIVSVRMEDEMAVVLQAGFSNLKPQVFGKNGNVVKGKVIRLFSDSVLVTFTGFEAFVFHPAVLKLENPESFEFPVFQNKFTPESEVIVTSNIQQLFKINKALRNWNRNVSIIAGKKVYYLQQCNKDFAVVCTGRSGPSWNMHVSVIYKIGEKDPFEVDSANKDQREDGSKLEDSKKEEGCKFMPEEPVKLKKIKNIREILTESDIPISFLEYLQSPLKVISYHEDKLHPNVEIHSNFFTIDSKLLEKLTNEEKERYESWSKADLHVGKRVHLDIGPPNYVKKTLKAFETSDEVIHAMTTSAKVVRFLGPHNVMIEYPEGKAYVIHKKYLTDPKKFNLDEEHDEIKQKDLISIQGEFVGLLDQAMEMDYDVVSIFPEIGQPLTMTVKLFSLTAEVEDVVTALGKTNIQMKELGNNVMELKGFKCYGGAVVVEIEVVCNKTAVSASQEKKKPSTEVTVKEDKTITEPAQAYSEKPSTDVAAYPDEYPTPLRVWGVTAEQQQQSPSYAVLLIPHENDGLLNARVRQLLGGRIQPPESDQIAVIHAHRSLQGLRGFNN